MNIDDELLSFVKAKLEEGEAMSDAALSRLLASAESVRQVQGAFTGRVRDIRFPRALLAAASLVVAVCGWLCVNDFARARHANDVANVITLLRMADGDEPDVGVSLPDALCAFQDSPAGVAVD